MAIPHNHAGTTPSPRKREAPSQAATNVSWMTSETASGSAHRRDRRAEIHGALRS